MGAERICAGALIAVGVALALALTRQAAAQTPPDFPAWLEGQATAQTQPNFPAWLEGMRQEAVAAGISQSTVDAALGDIEPVQRILERDRHQAEFILRFRQYLDRVATKDNIKRGRNLLATHGNLLARVADRYQVQPRFILAIWGIETRYGRVKATMPVVPALATLAFDRRRSSFFRKELMAALRMIDRQYIDLPSMRGSWAGAMGQPQFIPTSYLSYAQDFDGDGRRDIWSTKADVFASIANYLAQQGWNSTETWGREVSLPEGFEARFEELKRQERSGCTAIDKMTVPMLLSEWQAMGVRRAYGNRDLPTREMRASLVRPDGPDGPKFLVYRNYHAILRYNCAHNYGLTVGTLADRIAGR